MTTLTAEERDAIIDAADKKTRAEFSDVVAARTVLTTQEVERLGQTQEERKALAAVIAAVKAATASNQAKAKSVRSINGGVEALVKIAKLIL